MKPLNYVTVRPKEQKFYCFRPTSASKLLLDDNKHKVVSTSRKILSS